jgi:hypothetical protein
VGDQARLGVNHGVDVSEPTAYPPQYLRVLALIVGDRRDGEYLITAVAVKDSRQLSGVLTCHCHAAATAQQLAGKPVTGIRAGVSDQHDATIGWRARDLHIVHSASQTSRAESQPCAGYALTQFRYSR